VHCLGKDKKLTKTLCIGNPEVYVNSRSALAIHLLFVFLCVFSPGILHFFLFLHKLLSELDRADSRTPNKLVCELDHADSYVLVTNSKSCVGDSKRGCFFFYVFFLPAFFLP
jgi:hypothetical protein